MFDKISPRDRRTFLRNAGVMFAAMHAPGEGLTHTLGAIAGQPDSPDTSKPVDFRQFDLLSNRMDEQREFYTKLFSLPLVEETADSFTIQTGKTRIRFINDENAHDQVLCHFAFNIPENQIESAKEWVEKRWPLLRRRSGEHIVHFRRANGHAIYWFDPSGHLVEFNARHNLPNAKPGPFTIDNVYNASEIGLVTPDVVATCDELEKKTDLKVRSWSRGNGSFAPTGNLHGYFIVVKQDRIWLMTDIPSRHIPIRVVMGGEKPGKVKMSGLPFEIEIVA